MSALGWVLLALAFAVVLQAWGSRGAVVFSLVVAVLAGAGAIAIGTGLIA